VLYSSALKDSNEHLFNKEAASSSRKAKLCDVLKKNTVFTGWLLENKYLLF
jgi:hypothetical protein